MNERNNVQQNAEEVDNVDVNNNIVPNTIVNDNVNNALSIPQYNAQVQQNLNQVNHRTNESQYSSI